MTTTARFDLKLHTNDKDWLSRAAKEKAQTLLEQQTRVTLSKKSFAELQKALKRTAKIKRA